MMKLEQVESMIKPMTGLDAIEAICDGEIDRAINWAQKHGVEMPDSPQDMEKQHRYAHDARYAYPKRTSFIRNVIEHLRTTDPDDGIVSGRLEALAEKFERNAETAYEKDRHSASDIWRDAATDTKRLIPND